MARNFVTPTVVMGRCIEFYPCRWNGEMVTSHIVEHLKDFVDFIPVCPEMDRTVANQIRLEPVMVMEQYKEQPARALAQAPRCTANINVLLHAGGYFRDWLNHEEKAFFLDAIPEYREGRVSICAPKTILKAWIVRFGEENLNNQTFFAPYPDQLMEPDPLDMDRGRDLWT